MCIGQDLDSVAIHILEFLEAVLQRLFKAVLRRIAVQRNTALRTFFVKLVHTYISPFLRDLPAFRFRTASLLLEPSCLRRLRSFVALHGSKYTDTAR